VKKIIKYFDSANQVVFNREYLIFTGKYKGIPVSVCSTGVGCPGAAIAIEELANIGAKIFIRIGTCGGLKKEIKPGDLIIPTAAIRAEGTTKEYISLEFPAVADFDITEALVESAKTLKLKYFKGVNRTHDAFYEHIDNLAKWGHYLQDPRMKKWSIPSLVSSEMECSAIYLVAMLRGLKAGAVLSVNTTEPLETLKEDSGAVYELIENKDAIEGVDKAIRTALGAVEIIKQRDLV
jgi:uridine phosphorylase